MQKPVKTVKRQLLRIGSCALSALMVLGSIPAAAIDGGVTATYDEAYYAMTDYYGNLTDGSVVKSYRTNGISTLTDYGDYDEVINLTDGTEPTRTDGKTVFQLDESNLPGTFYFEGKTAKPFERLPWTLSVSYTLNGVPTKAEDLAGKTGVVEINLDAVPNETASEYARNNYTLEAMAIFNQDDILSLEAPGAQVQLIGNLRAVLFIGLPGEECHYTIRVGSDDFSFGGMTFLMVPATLSQLEEITKLSERKDDLEENYNKLSGSMDSLLDAMAAMTGSLNASANGLDQLNQARNIFSSGKNTIYSGTDALRADLSNLADVLEPVESQITALSKTITSSKATLNSMVNTVSTLRKDLVDVEDALEDLEDGKGDLQDVLDSMGSLRRSLKKLQDALGGTVKDTTAEIDKTIDANQNIGSITVAKVKKAHSAYVEKDRKTFYQDLLELNGTANAAETAAAAAGAVENLEKAQAGLSQYQAGLETLKQKLAAAANDEEKAQIEAQIAAVNAKITELETTISALQAGIQQQGVDRLETGFQAKAGMTFQQFCQKVLGQDAATAKQMSDLWLVYASGKVEGGDTPASGGTLSGELLHNDAAASSEEGSADTGSDESKTEESADSSESVGGAVVDLISGGLDSAMAEIAKLQKSVTDVMTKLKNPTTQVVNDLSTLCGRIEDLSDMLDSAEDLSAAIRYASSDLRDILSDVEKLRDTLNDYEPTLQESLKTVSSLSNSAVKTIRDTQSLVTDTENLMKSTGSTLDDGTKQTLEGLAAVLRSTAKTMSTAGQIKDAKSSICDIIEDTWDEYTGDVNNLLLMDATADAVSLTDSRNPSPESIQVLIRTQEITVPDEADDETENAAETQTTFWGRVAQMFKDLWSAVTGLFGGKD